MEMKRRKVTVGNRQKRNRVNYVFSTGSDEFEETDSHFHESSSSFTPALSLSKFAVLFVSLINNALFNI